MRVSFITWYPSCRRSDAIADALGGQSHLIHYFKFKQPLYAPLKYLLQSFSTFRQLWRDRPDLVLVASPPIVAPLCVWLYCFFARVPYVVDAHTGVFDDPRWEWMTGVSRFLSRRALTTIVTNDYLAGLVREWGARALVIGDVPVTFPETGLMDFASRPNVAVINTFSQDEPLDRILQAARLADDVQFHITGNTAHARQDVAADIPRNVRFTGWITDDEYASLLRSVDAVMCLTDHDHTMQRGAYEAMALAKPLVTSSWDILRRTFSRGTIHIDNQPAAIADAVRRATAEADQLSRDMAAWREERRTIFDAGLSALIQQVNAGKTALQQ